MQLTDELKRSGLLLVMTGALLALCLALAQLRGPYGPPMHSVGAGVHEMGAVDSHSLHGPHAVPWGKVVATRMISIARYLGA